MKRSISRSFLKVPDYLNPRPIFSGGPNFVPLDCFPMKCVSVCVCEGVLVLDTAAEEKECV